MEQWQIERAHERLSDIADRITFHNLRISELMCETIKKKPISDFKERIAWHESRIKILQDEAYKTADELSRNLLTKKQ